MGDHNDQTVLCHFLQNLHNLHAGLRIQCAGRLVGKDDLRVIYQCTGNGNTLHLSTGKLAGTFAQLVTKTHLLQGLLSAHAALPLGNTGQGQCQLHILQNTLVRNQVIALEHKADGMIPVGIPVTVLKIPCGTSVDHQIAAGIPVQTADNIQHCGLAAAGGS